MKRIIVTLIYVLSISMLFSSGSLESMIGQNKTHIAIVTSEDMDEIISGSNLAMEENNDLQVEVLVAQNALEIDALITSAVNSNFHLISAYGIFDSIVFDKALLFPEETFALFSQSSYDNLPANLINVRSSIYSSSYLCGIASGLLTESKAIGIIANCDDSYYREGVESFVKGVESVNRGCSIIVSYMDDVLSSVSLGKAISDSLFSEGCDIIFSLSSPVLEGILLSAEEYGGKIISGDIALANPNVILSVDINTEREIQAFINKVVNGFEAGNTMTLDLEDGRSDLSWFIGEVEERRYIPDNMKQSFEKAISAVSRVRDRMISGLEY